MTDDFEKLASEVLRPRSPRSKKLSVRLYRLYYKIAGKIDRAYYWTRALFFPYNVVKIQKLNRTWSDRDYIMFHANFQILVDFIELEQPFVSYEDHKRGRLIVSPDEMRDFVNRNHDPDESYNNEQDKDFAEHAKESLVKARTEYLTLIDLYEWYTTDQYIKPMESLDRTDVIDDKLLQLIKLRRTLWT